MVVSNRVREYRVIMLVTPLFAGLGVSNKRHDRADRDRIFFYKHHFLGPGTSVHLNNSVMSS